MRPEGQHDDRADAYALALVAVRRVCSALIAAQEQPVATIVRT